nr:hypothetical protein [Tanacetum cinerariifolium]
MKEAFRVNVWVPGWVSDLIEESEEEEQSDVGSLEGDNKMNEDDLCGDNMDMADVSETVFDESNGQKKDKLYYNLMLMVTKFEFCSVFKLEFEGGSCWFLNDLTSSMVLQEVHLHSQLGFCLWSEIQWRFIEVAKLLRLPVVAPMSLGYTSDGADKGTTKSGIHLKRVVQIRWPICDSLITFHSSGYLFEKAEAYVALKN